MKDTEKLELFANCPVWKAVIKLAVPTVIGQIILVVYNMADTFFIGLTGSDAMMIFRMTHQETAASKLAEKGAALVSQSEIDRL